VEVFISWSGEQSKHIAQALREWLPRVLQAIKPYMSDEDNEAGVLWDQVMTAQLEASNFGILCLTPGNVQSPWIHFEAGALGKLTNSRVIALRHQLSVAAVRPPLTRFQSRPLDKKGIHDALRSMNNVLPLEQRRKDIDLDALFDTVWPKLQELLDAVPTDEEPPLRPERELLEELLELVRLGTVRSVMSRPGIPQGIFDRLSIIVGDDGSYRYDGKELILRSPRFRNSMADLSIGEQRFLNHTHDFATALGVEVRVFDDLGNNTAFNAYVDYVDYS
jgi:hypothetical protein